MPKSALSRVPSPVIETGGITPSGDFGTRLAINHILQSDPISPAGSGWGGARNRRDRGSDCLTLRQCEGLIAAADHAERIGLAFNRHWTIHIERAGIADADGAQFVGRLLKLARDYAGRNGAGFAAVWVRENGDSKGSHVHILMHLPAALSLKGKTQKWVRLAGGASCAKVSHVRAVGRRLLSAENRGQEYAENANRALAYLLKGASRESVNALSLPRHAAGGYVIGKRCGWSQNIGSKARQAAAEATSPKWVLPSGRTGRVIRTADQSQREVFQDLIALGGAFRAREGKQ